MQRLGEPRHEFFVPCSLIPESSLGLLVPMRWILLSEDGLGNVQPIGGLGDFRLLCCIDEVLKLAKLLGGRGLAKRVHRMYCKSGWIRFLNRFATHPVEELVANWGNSFQIYYSFKKTSRASQ
jgi:hypothetical protein